ncbi:acetyl-CoA carboxylase biotin carboxyl carrier protein subunit, partial [Bordetella bronchiseptica]
GGGGGGGGGAGGPPRAGAARAARPGAQPLAAPGDRLAAHAPVCVIEAMKMMTEVSAERAGAVLRVLCEDGQAVEQGQPLLVIQPDEPRHVP